MGTITAFVKRVGSVLASLPIFRANSYETCLTYDRTDGKRIEFVIVHPLNVAGDCPKKPFLVLCSRTIARNPNCTLNALINLSMEEGRLLRDYMNRPEVTTWLEEGA